MPKVLIFFATKEGHCARIAEYLARAVRSHQIEVQVFDAAKLPDYLSFEQVSSAFLVASVHQGRHEPEMAQLVKRYRTNLEHTFTVFFSVSLSQAGVEDEKAPRERRLNAQKDVKRMLESFLKETQWRPARVQPVAGALAYTQYGCLKRVLMKWISRRAGGGTDTSRDYDYTRWSDLDALVNDVMADQPVPLKRTE